MSRFLIPGYVVNSVRILLKSFTKGNNLSPYDTFCNNVSPVEVPTHTTRFYKGYHSFAYMNHGEAVAYYKDSEAYIVNIMLPLFYYNDLVSDKEGYSKKDFLISCDRVIVDGVEVGDYLVFPVYIENTLLNMSGEYYSGIIQGKAASLFIRAFIESDDEQYLHRAKTSLLAGQRAIEKNGICRKLANNLLWIEEYPAPKPSMVLNGMVFFLIGLAEYITIAKDDDMKEFYEHCIQSLLSWLPFYKQGNDFLYSMNDWRMANIHYIGVMHYQFDHLYKVTGIEAFGKIAKKCANKKQLNLFKKMLNMKIEGKS